MCDCFYSVEHDDTELCPACMAEIQQELADIALAEGNQELAEEFIFDDEPDNMHWSNEPEHWSDMASFGDNGWE